MENSIIKNNQVEKVLNYSGALSGDYWTEVAFLVLVITAGFAVSLALV